MTLEIITGLVVAVFAAIAAAFGPGSFTRNQQSGSESRPAAHRR